MNCLEFRRRLGSEPASSDAAFVAHREECARCASAQLAADNFEEKILAALRIPVSTHLTDSIILAQITESRQRGRKRKRSFGALIVAAAASILIALVATQRPQPNIPVLAGLVIEHLHKHVVSLADTQNPLSKQDVMAVFASRGVSLASVPDGINYVHNCPAGPYKTVHMVMPERDGQVSVVYVVDKASAQTIDFSNDSMRGREVPLGEGSLVMLAKDDRNFDAIESQWRRAMGQAVASLESEFPNRPGSGESFSPLIHETAVAAP